MAHGPTRPASGGADFQLRHRLAVGWNPPLRQTIINLLHDMYAVPLQVLHECHVMKTCNTLRCNLRRLIPARRSFVANGLRVGHRMKHQAVRWHSAQSCRRVPTHSALRQAWLQGAREPFAAKGCRRRPQKGARRARSMRMRGQSLLSVRAPASLAPAHGRPSLSVWRPALLAGTATAVHRCAPSLTPSPRYRRSQACPP